MNERKDIRLTVRVTNDQYELIKKQSAEMGPSEAEYIRRLLEQKPVMRIRVKRELNELREELDHVSNNLNQIAKAEAIKAELMASTWHELETKGKFDKNEKRSFISDDMLILGFAGSCFLCKLEAYMGRILFWLQRKKRMEKRACGMCCLNCKFYRNCRVDGKF